LRLLLLSVPVLTIHHIIVAELCLVPSKVLLLVLKLLVLLWWQALGEERRISQDPLLLELLGHLSLLFMIEVLEF
jgi:hypothetical protein